MKCSRGATDKNTKMLMIIKKELILRYSGRGHKTSTTTNTVRTTAFRRRSIKG